MPPIPIHLDAPINANASSTDAATAAKADGITPKTAPPPTRTTDPSRPSASTTTTLDTSIPPAPQPGASPYIPAPTTAFSTLSSPGDANAPPPPQPGAVPIPPQPTHVVEKVYTTTETRGPPPQASLPPPTDSQLSGKSTIPYQNQYPQAGSGPTTLPLGAANAPSQQTQDPWQSPIERPPGYIQNQRAFEDPPQLREAARRESAFGVDGNTQENIMSALNTAGESLKEGHQAVWDWVNGKK